MYRNSAAIKSFFRFNLHQDEVNRWDNRRNGVRNNENDV